MQPSVFLNNLMLNVFLLPYRIQNELDQGKFSTSTCTRLGGGNYGSFNTIKDTNRISKKNKRALYWFVPNNLYFIYYFSGYVTTNIDIFHVCYGHGYEKFPRSLSLLQENLTRLSLHDGKNQKNWKNAKMFSKDQKMNTEEFRKEKH